MRKLAKAILAIISETKEDNRKLLKLTRLSTKEVARLTNRLILRLRSQHLGSQEKADMRNPIEVK